MDKNHGSKILIQKTDKNLSVQIGNYFWNTIEECNILICIPEIKRTVTIKNGKPIEENKKIGLLQLKKLKDVVKYSFNEIKVLTQNLEYKKFEDYIILTADYIDVSIGESAVYGTEMLAKSKIEDFKTLLYKKVPQNVFESIKIVQEPLKELTELTRNYKGLWKNTPLKECEDLFFLLRELAIPIEKIEIENLDLKDLMLKINPKIKKTDEEITNLKEQLLEFIEFYMDNYRYYLDIKLCPLPIHENILQKDSLKIRNHLIENQFITIIVPKFKVALNFSQDILSFVEKALITHHIVDERYKNKRSQITFVHIVYYGNNTLEKTSIKTAFVNKKLKIYAKLHS